MTTDLKAAALVVLIGFALGVVATSSYNGIQLGRVKAYADSVAVESARKDSVAQAFSDSALAAVAHVHTRVASDSASHHTAESGLRTDTTARDSLAHYKAIARADLGQIAGLKAENVILRWRGDSLLLVVHDLNAANQSLRDKIKSLHDTPKWVTWSKRVVGTAAVFYGGVRVGQVLAGR